MTLPLLFARNLSAIAAFLFLAVATVHAQPGRPKITAEDRLLPRDCLYTNMTAHSAAEPEVYLALIKKYGQAWEHMHHYCNSMRLFIRYNQFGIPAYQKTELARRVINEVDYVIRNSPPDFSLMPMVLLKKAEYYMHFSQPTKAIEVVSNVVADYPELPEGYARLAYYFRRVGRTADADKVIEAGRARVPNKDELEAAIQRYASLK